MPVPEKVEAVVDDDLVAIFELLAQWDYADKQKEISTLQADPPSSSPGGQLSAQKNNKQRNEKQNLE